MEGIERTEQEKKEDNQRIEVAICALSSGDSREHACHLVTTSSIGLPTEDAWGDFKRLLEGPLGGVYLFDIASILKRAGVSDGLLEEACSLFIQIDTPECMSSSIFKRQKKEALELFKHK